MNQLIEAAARNTAMGIRVTIIALCCRRSLSTFGGVSKDRGSVDSQVSGHCELPLGLYKAALVLGMGYRMSSSEWASLWIPLGSMIFDESIGL